MEPTQPIEPRRARREREVHRLLAEAMERPTEERAAHVAASGREREVVDEVLGLLAEEPALGAFLEASALEVATAAAVSEGGDGLGSFGPYRLLELLGEGGMGKVYLAEQHVPVVRRVALKLMHSHLAGAEARARFAVERQAMARLGHPSVGQILEAGATADGMPFLAMEWIDGPPITEYCDQRELGIEARVELLVQVCRGVHHAHQKQILHRDLKPSNILVAEVDGRPQPKIIDFGIAKDLEQEHGRTGDRVIGTLDYMSPEALSPGESGADIDTRADVYALGVLLYELLAGVRPFRSSRGSLETAIERLSTTAPKPSARLATVPAGDAARIAARRRQRDLQTLRKRLRGDLDWIAARAIAPDREARYASAAELADDLERVLRHQPVIARPAEWLYVARRFARRHVASLAAAGAVLAALVVGLIGTTIGLRRASAAEAVARAQASAAEQARGEAAEVAKFLMSLFRESEPGQALARGASPADALTARQILDDGAARLASELADRPLVRARLEETIGTVYAQLALYDQAERHLLEALSLRQAHLPPEHVDLATSRGALGRLYLHRGRLDEAGEQFEAARVSLARGGASAEHAILLGDMGRLARQQGHFDEAQKLLERALELQEATLPANDPELAVGLNNLGNLHFSRGRAAEAEVFYARAVEVLRAGFPVGHPRLVQGLGNLAAALATQGRLEEAAVLFEETLAARRAVLGNDHPAVAESLNNLGVLRLDLGQAAAAEPLHREALAIRERVLGPNHPLVAWSLENLGRVRESLGDRAEAEALLRQALAVREGALGVEHPDVGRSLDRLGRLVRARGDLAGARAAFERALAIRDTKLGPDHEDVHWSRLHLGLVVWELGDPRRGRELLLAATAGLVEPETSAELTQARQLLGL